jgi:hypothetical protein
VGEINRCWKVALIKAQFNTEVQEAGCGKFSHKKTGIL